MRDLFTPKGRINMHVVREKLLDKSLWGRTKPSTSTIDSWIEQFWFQDLYECILMVSWVLDHLITFIQKNRKLPFRFEFYRYLILSITKENRFIIQDLYKIGLHFELLQQNQLPSDKFAREIKKLKLGKVSLKWLADNKIIEVVSEEVDGVVIKNTKWFHHSFTEFLTADEILRSDVTIEARLNALAVVHLDEDNTDNIKPSWNGVIGFLLDSDRGKETLEWTISLIEKNPLNLFENLAKSIVRYAPARISDGMKDRVFRAIYGTIQDRCTWIRNLPSFGLWRFYTKNQLAIIDKDSLATGDEVTRYVHQGNAVAYLTELIRHNKIPETLKKTWKSRLIQFAQDDNKNGVLQRYTLDALELYRDAHLVKILKPYYDLPERKNDQLLSQAFVDFCRSLEHKNNESVEVLINAAKEKMDVYGRHGLQELSKKKEFILFLRALVTDPVFLDRFIDSESIFSGDSDDEGDRSLIGKIVSLGKNDRQIQRFLYDITVAALKNPNLYDLHRSYLIRNFFAGLPDRVGVVEKLLRLAAEEKEQDKHRFAYKLFDLLPAAFTSKNWKRLLFLIEKSGLYPDQRVNDVVYGLRWLEDEQAKQLFAVIARQIKLPIESAKSITEQEVDKNQKILKDFQWKLQPEPGQYMTDVFEYYLQNAKVLDPLKPKDKKRLFYLAYDDGIKRLDPNEFNLKIIDFPAQRNQFTWSRQASFFGDMVRVVEKLAPKKLRDRDVQQHLVDFIPFTYTEDLLTICKHVTIITENQLLKLNVHIEDINDHRRYHSTDSYVSFIEHLSKANDVHFCLPVLKSLIGAKNIDEWVSVKALKVYGSVVGKTVEYRNILNEIFTQPSNPNRLLKEEANKQLIELFSDGPAINWRIAQIKGRMRPFTPPVSGIAHSVGPDEEEFDSMKFAKPLTRVTEMSVFQNLSRLYRSVAARVASDKGFESYQGYVWKVLLAYVENQDLARSLQMQNLLMRRNDISVWQREELRQIRLNLINNSYVGGKING